MSYAFEYEYEQPEQDDVDVSVELDLSWSGPDRGVGETVGQCEVEDFSFTVNGRAVPWNMVSKEWVLDSFPEILDRAAFMADLDKRVETFMETAEAPEPEPDYDHSF